MSDKVASLVLVASDVFGDAQKSSVGQLWPVGNGVNIFGTDLVDCRLPGGMRESVWESRDVFFRHNLKEEIIVLICCDFIRTNQWVQQVSTGSVEPDSFRKA